MAFGATPCSVHARHAIMEEKHPNLFGWSIMISAIVVAAGLSRRMGQFKLLMPWRGATVIGQIVATLEAAGLADIVVVTGHRSPEVVGVLAGCTARTVYNAGLRSGRDD